MLKQHEESLQELINLHNEVARAFKLVENLNFEIDMTSLNDARYALRAVMDCLNSALNEDDGHFEDALSRAKLALHISWHDLVDIAHIEFKLYLESITKKYSPDIVAGSLNIKSCKDIIYKIEDTAREARGDRDRRIELYRQITTDDLETVLTLYREASDAEPVMQSRRKKEKRDNFYKITGVAVSVIILGVIIYVNQ